MPLVRKWEMDRDKYERNHLEREENNLLHLLHLLHRAHERSVPAAPAHDAPELHGLASASVEYFSHLIVRHHFRVLRPDDGWARGPSITSEPVAR